MTVRIQSINVRGLGPIEEIAFELGDFNLIYGKNERGKTYLVEFLLRSLFRSDKEWSLRGSQGSGKVVLEGLTEQPAPFSPQARKKIEDYLEEQVEGLPPNLSRLLVVKGAELSMARKVAGGVDRAILKEYLSSEALLDVIMDRISKTIQKPKTNIVDGEIEGDNRGEIADRRELRDDLERIDPFFSKIEVTLSDGQRAALRSRIEAIRADLEQQEQAKRYKAYRISEDIEALKEETHGLTRNLIDRLKDESRKRDLALANIRDNEEKLKKLGKASDDFIWLDGILPKYEAILQQAAGKKPTWGLIAGGASICISLLAFGAKLVLRTPGPLMEMIGLAGLVAALAFLVAYWRTGATVPESDYPSQEIKAIQEEYAEKFQRKIASVSSLSTQRDELHRFHAEAEILTQQIETKKTTEVMPAEAALRQMLSSFECDSEDPDSWQDVINKLARRLSENEQAINDAETALQLLDVEPEAYVKEDAGIPYSKTRVDKLTKEKDAASQDLDQENRKTDELKNQIMGQLGETDPSLEWEQLIELLQQKRGEIADLYKKLTAEIIAKILLRDELNAIKAQENEKIAQSLTSELITRPLFKLTQKYRAINLVGEALEVSDGFSSFPISELSTGAQEQVLLALRIGFASRILGADKLFLILDDAFQHADWDRRGYMLEEIIGLTKTGWQCTYLTMDDHIRDIFKKHGKKAFEDRFAYFELP